MEGVGWLVAIVIGILAGFIAEKLMRRDHGAKASTRVAERRPFPSPIRIRFCAQGRSPRDERIPRAFEVDVPDRVRIRIWNGYVRIGGGPRKVLRMKPNQYAASNIRQPANV